MCLGNDRFLDVFDAEDMNFKTLSVPTDHKSRDMTSAYAKKGRVFCAFQRKGSVAVWDAKSGNLLTVIPIEISTADGSLEFFKTVYSNEIALYSDGGMLRLVVRL